MIYELREYAAMPGKMPDLLARFENDTLRIFEKHGMKLEGFWLKELGGNSNNNELAYLLSFENYGELESKWKNMINDPEWINIRKLTEKDGPLVANVKRTILRQPPFMEKHLKK